MVEQGRASGDGGTITGNPGCGQQKKRESRLKAVFSDLIQPRSNFRSLGLKCSANDFPGFRVIGAVLSRADEFLREGDEIRQVSLKALFRKQPSRLMEGPGEQPVLFIPLHDRLGEGVAIAWLPERQPASGHHQDPAEAPKCGEVWFGLATLILAYGGLAATY